MADNPNDFTRYADIMFVRRWRQRQPDTPLLTEAVGMAVGLRDGLSEQNPNILEAQERALYLVRVLNDLSEQS